MKDFIFIDQDMDALKAGLTKAKDAVFKRLIDQSENYFGEDLPEEHPPRSTTYMGMAIANLSLAYVLTKEARYLNEAKRWISRCLSYPHWGNAFLVDVDLSAAWILFGFALAYDWLRESFSSDEKRAMKEKIILQGSRMYNFKVGTEGSGWSTNYWQNHNWINMTGLASAGYALINEASRADDPDAVTGRAWTECAKENFDTVYSVLSEDGSDYEGVVYWRYGAMWLFVYAHLLKEREGIDYFKTCSFLKETFFYRLYQAAPNLEEQMNFGDAHDRISGHSTAIYYKTAAEYGNGHAQKLGNLVRDEFLMKEAESKVKPGILPECFFEMLFYDESVEEEEFSSLPLSRYFDDLGLFVRRSSWERDADLFTFKCSHPGGKKQWDLLWKLKEEKGYNCFGLSHQHPDNNSFLFHSKGEYIAIDDGYNRNVRASDHNVVLVDGMGYEDEGQNNIWKTYTRDMIGDILNFIIRDDLNYLVGETAPVYRKDLNLTSFKRHVINTGKSWYLLLDELSSRDEHIYTWQMFSDYYPDFMKDHYRYRIGKADVALYHYSDAPTVSDLKENTVRAVMTTQEPDKFTENHMKGLCISNRDKLKEVSFISVIVPDGDSCLIEKIEIDGAYGVVIKDGHQGSFETILYSRRGEFRYKNRFISASVALIREDHSGIQGVNTLSVP